MPLTLNKLRNVSFLVTDEQMLLKINDLGTQALDPAAQAIAQDVDADIANALLAAAVGGGGGGTVTMATVANDAFRGARTKLSRNNAPPLERYAVLSPEGIAVALADPLLIQAQQAGSTDALREANIGRILGLDTYETQQLGYGPGARWPGGRHRLPHVRGDHGDAAAAGTSRRRRTRRSRCATSSRSPCAWSTTTTTSTSRTRCRMNMLYGLAAARPQLAVQLSFGQGS